jgi:hypothetical protein
MKTQISLEVTGNLPNQTLERKFSNQQLSGFLELADLPQSYGARSVSVGFLDTSARGS